MLHNRKNVFWQALLSAILIFGLGLLLGVAFEQSRNNSVADILLKSEVNVLDSQLIRNVGGDFDISCEVGEEKLVQFADEIFNEARQLERYEESSQLTNVLDSLHRRYDLLRLILWQQAIDLKKNCDTEYHTVVYFYQFKNPSLNLKSEQIVFSRALLDLKEEYGNKVILIPIAGDLGLSSIDLVMSSYGVEDYPFIIIDEDNIIDSVEGLAQLDSLIN